MAGIYPQNSRIGYVRVSTVGQTLDNQLDQLRGAGCRRIYREKITGTHNDRRQLLNRNAPAQEASVVTDVPARFPAEHPIRPARIHQNDREQE